MPETVFVRGRASEVRVPGTCGAASNAWGHKAISITSATFMERAHRLYESLGFRRAPERDWYVPGEDVLLWVFRLEL